MDHDSDLATRATCLTSTEVRDLITASLSPHDGLTLSLHLALCPRCREEVDDRQEFESIRRAFQSASAPGSPPPEVPHHAVETLIGRGGFGEVWLGRHRTLDQPRALKFLHARHLRAGAIEGLAREARIMAALLPHANRVQVFDLIEQPEGAVLAMAFVDGGALSLQAPLPWAQAVRYVLGVGEGLGEVHGQGLLHRDIKPANILWDRTRDAAVLGDFGLAVHVDGPIQLAGTSGYLAPELLDEPATVQADVFALAATLFHLVVGSPPFDARNPYLSLAQARDGLPRPLSPLSALPRGIEEVIRAGLEPDPRRRPDLGGLLARLRVAHLHELAEALRALSRRSTCPTRLSVTVSVADAGEMVFRPALSCTNHDRGPDEAGAPLPVVSVRAGDLLRIEAVADTHGHLTILNFDPAGTLDVLLPNPPGADYPVDAGAPHALTVRMKPSPAGDRTAILWTRGPNRMSPDAWRDRIAAGRITEPDRGMDYLLHESGAPAPDDWTAVVVGVECQE